ncbi:hypothetical protein VCHA54P496_130097 [Vibrio chagasii]|nr:hypothetical protein VCHA54P495_130097 [Vibrio chagasii]CAH6976058.1 hypothetical protein VCHA54P496_130097 [Vibrio chagasii]
MSNHFLFCVQVITEYPYFIDGNQFVKGYDYLCKFISAQSLYSFILLTVL